MTAEVTTEATEEVVEVSPESSVQGKESDSLEVSQENKETSEYITKDDFKAVLGRLDGMSATINRISKSKDKTEPKKDTKKQGSELEARFSNMEERLKESAEREAKAMTASKKNSLRSALVKGGVLEVQADMFATYLMNEKSDNLDAEFDGQGYKVSYKDTDDSKVEIDSWVNMYLQSDAGAAMLPTKKNPKFTTPTNSKANPKEIVLSEDEFKQALKDNKYTPEQLKNNVKIRK